MRRLPIYFLIDVSESMVGEPLQHVEEGMAGILKELRTDPYALETAYVSFIAFAGKAKSLAPLTELYKFNMPRLSIGEGTNLSAALNFLMRDMDKNLKETTYESKGDWKPIIFLFTDGVPTDDPSSTIALWNSKYKRKCSFIAVSIGNNADTQLLGKITEDVLLLKNVTAESFNSFFKWITASIKVSSMSVSEQSSDTLNFPTPDGINLEKVDPTKPCIIDENFAVLHGKCSSTKKEYLIKFGKKSPSERKFSLIGSYPIDQEQYAELSDKKPINRSINSSLLEGIPSCPCCNNQLALVHCGVCSKIFCVREGDQKVVCPWCNSNLSLSYSESLNYSQQRG